MSDLITNVDHSWSRKVKDTTGQYSSPISALSDTLRNEGLKAFYKGTLAPLIGVGACVSVQFYGFHEAKRQILKHNPKQHDLTLGQFYVAGAFAGIVNAPITSPVEQIRILLQVQKDNLKLYNGPRDAISKIYKQAGLLKGIFRGSMVTFLREAQAYGVWFLTYEFLISKFIQFHKTERHNISTMELLVCGAVAGDALWISSYPLDVVKSRLQSDGFGRTSRYKGSVVEVAKHIMRHEGPLGFWKGIGPTLLRAIPCSAATFTTVEYVLRLLD
ncbi:hypothetical protein KL921_003915 [Ogataea angusta]|uniref:Uncharacterized protein n=1 Tax=Pichia angusta TaxID=870730 RepID=A0AAN6I4Q6_PICAN|nr:uncharacterized protein KL928_004156 [Ogataea angusta]KAG7808833.1 hypothetical protein KL921_003915 [Ogataea angusta]KAG7817421.1 hypothetical protein KL928_004156 [Ogataea angusta]KAG7823738.1 hypothetical protein KL909_003135 [Ogataea angusta]KAG7828925.1 hypothetical protein KL920_003421 [Ogataea angusta]KAG7833446.1 hypothetical protein KL943_004311 [Ogataea angusta]